jgi:hypothetical protein
MIDNDIQVSALWKMYEDAQAYQDTIGLSSDVPMWVRFYEGDQWPRATKNTQHLPRPVVNMTKMVCRNKKANILSTPVKLVYETDDGSNAGKKFTEFTAFIEKEMQMKKLDASAVKDGVVKGTYVYHYYWDADAVGKKAEVQGGVRCEIVDVLNTFVANPKEIDEQKQKWIMFSSREEVETVKAICDDDVDKDLIIPDDVDWRYDNNSEQEGTAMCTVLTRYFRINGEVYWEKAVKNTIITKPTPLTPDVSAEVEEIDRETETAEKKAKNKKKVDVADTALPDKAKGSHKSYKARLYPVVIASYEERDKCIYGMSEVANLIANQRAINNNLAMGLLAVENNSWGKYIVHKNALKGQKITNQPAQVLVDYSDTGNGIRKLAEQQPSDLSIHMADKLLELSRAVSGSTEIMTGEAIGKNQSGAAIAQLQATASMPIEELRTRFWDAKERSGKILEQFFKLYYESKDFSYKKEVINPVTNQKEEQVVSDVFKSSEMVDMDFTVTVEAIGGTRATAASDIAFLESMFQAGAIDAKTFVKSFPADAISNKSELQEALEEQEQSALLQAQQTIEQMQLQLQQAQVVTQQAQSLINENQQLRAQLISLYTEAKAKVDFANKAIQQVSEQYNEVYSDAQGFAQEIYNNRMQESKPNVTQKA